MITDKNLANSLRKLNDEDREESHVEADRLLCAALIELGYSESVMVYKSIPKWFA